MAPVLRDSVLGQLDRMLSSSIFQGAERSRALLRFLVEQTLNHQADRLKEYTLGAEVLGKGDSFDPRTDPIVRAEASRLRSRLERYYGSEGQADPVVIALPKGSYVPQFQDREIAAGGVATPLPKGAQAGPSRPGRLTWLALGTTAAACAFGAAMWARTRVARPAEAPLVQFDVELRSGGSLGSEVGTDLILSPDGTRVVFVSRGPDGTARLNTRRLDQSSVTELPGTEGARGPFFAPDGRWVGFWASGKLKKTTAEGGLPVVLCDATDLLGGTWGEDGNIIAALSPGKLWRIPSAGGGPTVILDLSKESVAPLWPQILPGARAVLFTAIGALGPNGGTVEALTLADGRRAVLARGGTFGRYLSTGHLVYVNQGTLFAVALDLDRLRARGTPIPVLDDVAYSSAFGFAQLDFSRTGTLAYRRNPGGGQLTAEWLDSRGNREPLLGKPGRFVWPGLSPDGQRLALSVIESGAASIWIHEHRLDRTTRLSPTVGGPLVPLWNRDGRLLILGGPGGLSWVRADGAGKPEQLTRGTGIQIPWSFTPDGTRLAYHEMSSSTGFDLWTVPVQADGTGLKAGTPEPFLQTPAFEVYPSFSPDGRWLAYGSNESRTWEVYVRAFPDRGLRVRVSDAGGRIPRWSPNGRELFYRTDDQRIMVTTYTAAGGSFVADKPRPWSQAQLGDTGVLANFDLAPDGTRIVALMPAGGPENMQTENHVTVMLNFFDEVRRRVAALER